MLAVHRDKRFSNSYVSAQYDCDWLAKVIYETLLSSNCGIKSTRYTIRVKYIQNYK